MQSAAKQTYRLLITRRRASEILVVPCGSDWRLPRIEIRKNQRVAEELTRETHKSWGLETYCLFLPSPAFIGPLQSDEPASGAKCAVLECVYQGRPAPEGTFWLRRELGHACGDLGEAAVIQDTLAELEWYATGTKAGPFARPGWLRELFQWSQEQIGALGLRLTGAFQQFNAGPAFSLIRLELENGAAWFKATGEPNAHELPVTLLLAHLFPAYLPRILGVHATWNGWLAAEAGGQPLDELTDCFAWERAAEALAQLQVASIAKTRDLLTGPCKDIRLTKVEPLIDPFLTRMGEFMAVQEKASPPPLTAGELNLLAEALRETIALLESFHLPNTLGHLDANPGNLIVSQKGCVFLDWAEACVTHPFVTFEYLRRHMEKVPVSEAAAEPRLTTAYLKPWTHFFSLEDLRRCTAAVPPIAVLVHALSSETWLTLKPEANPVLAAYFRSLTRRMYRDAVAAAERSARCLT